MYQKLCTEFYDNDKPLANKQEVDFYGQFFNKEQLILEPMCGTGRLLIPMLEAGFKVHGVDNSIPMLANCKERLKQRHLNTEIFEASITEMKLSRQYDGIIIPFGSFQLLYPRTVAYKTLELLHQSLKPGGKLILDMFIPWEAMYLNGEVEVGEKHTTLLDSSVITQKFNNQANKIEQYSVGHSIYEKKMNDKIIAIEEEKGHLCWYFLYEFELILEKYGFSNIKRLSKTIDNETLTVYVAEKPS